MNRGEGDPAGGASRTPLPRPIQEPIHAIVLSGSAKGTTRRVGSKLRIGKAPDNDLVLGDSTVADHHCELTPAGGGVHVKDLGSTQGTRLEGARVTEAVVPPGTVLAIGEVHVALRAAARDLDVPPSDKTWFGAAVGQSLPMRSVFGALEHAAATDVPILLEGEAGTGKDLLARAVWTESARAHGPFVVVDCSEVRDAQLESELFGHERGASFEAVAARPGAFELAHGGTVFLDEVGELSLDLQSKLSHMLGEGTFRRAGGHHAARFDVRVVAATRRALSREVAAGKFREDLYARIGTVSLVLPPLRARREDIPMIAERVLNASGGGLSLRAEAMEGLLAHDWPGNVRELRGVLERAIDLARADGHTQIGAAPLLTSSGAAGGVFSFEPTESYRQARAKYDDEFERRYVRWLLARHKGNMSAAAREARMDRKHLYDMAKKRGLRGPESEPSEPHGQGA